MRTTAREESGSLEADDEGEPYCTSRDRVVDNGAGPNGSGHVGDKTMHNQRRCFVGVCGGSQFIGHATSFPYLTARVNSFGAPDTRISHEPPIRENPRPKAHYPSNPGPFLGTYAPHMLISRKSDLICREVDGKLVGLDLRSSRYFSLNPTGTRLWRLLETGSDSDALVDALVEAHQIDRDVAETDVAQFIDSLRTQELLE